MKRAFPIWFLFLVALAAPAAAQSLDLTRARVPGGGGVSAGGQFTLFSTVAQPESVARVAGGSFTLDSGFLGVTLPSPIPTVYFPSGTVTVLEDAGAQTRVSYATFEPGDAGPPAQPATFQLSNNNAALFSVAPAIATDRTLTFTPAANASGSATVTVVVRADGVNVATNTFSIVVTPVNDAPSVTLAGNQTVLEDAGAQTVSGFATFTAGPADESAQAPTHTLTADNPALFSAGPAIAANGTLTYTPAANANGSATITVVTSDGGGTANGGVDRTTNTFTITVTAVNDAPSVAYAMIPVVVLEDAGAQTVSSFATFTAGPADESTQTPSYTLTASAPALFSSQPALAANGTLTFTPAPNANGSAIVTVITADGGGTANGGVDRSTNTFTITVTPVNDAPAATYATNNVTVLEDAGAQSISGFATFTPGPADEAAQTATYTLTADNAALFGVQPALAANGTLTFTPAANANGSATVTVVVADTGAAANGGVDRSTNTFTITLTAVNDAPTVTLAQSTVTVLEDAGAQSLVGFATFSSGPANESAQALAGYTVSHNNSALFSSAPALAANGTLTFTPAVNANGSATVTVIAQDNGGTTGGGVDRTTNSFTITVTAVNDAPAVVFSANPVVVAIDSGAQMVTGFATFTAGPSDESAQTPAYTVTTDNAGLFSAAPAIAANGTLTFTTATGVGGAATVTVVVQDTGGIANGGVDKATNTFTLSVLTFAGVADSFTVAEDATLTRAAAAGVLANDIGPMLRSVLVATTTNGTLALNLDGSFTYQPATNFFGTDHFTYLATNSADTSAVTLVTITVGSVNDAPSCVLSATPTAMLTGLNSPQALAFDGGGNLFVANGGGTVSIFAPGATTFFAVLTGHSRPGPLAFDGAGNLFVANSGDTTVSKYAPGATTVTATLTGVPWPSALAFDGVGNLLVANDNGDIKLSRFAPGATTASATFTGITELHGPQALAFDAAGNLFVSNGEGTTVSKFAPGATTPSATLTGLRFPSALAFDESGNLFVVSYYANTVSKFAPGATTPSATLSGLNGPVALAFDRAGNLCVANITGNTVSKFAPGTTTASQTLTGLKGPVALAFDSTGNMFVANRTGNTVSKYGSNVSVAADAGARTMTNFATSISPGPTNEAGQTVSFIVTSDNQAIFSVQPAISTDGTLTFTPLASSNGTARVTVVAHDDGGTANGGVDSSAPQTFTISVTGGNVLPVNSAPGYSVSGSTSTGSGTLWTWGLNHHGQLGNGTSVDKSSPGSVDVASSWRSITAGHNHALAVRDDGTLWAWGENNDGQLGDGTFTHRVNPVQVGTNTDWRSVTAGQDYSVALKADGTLWAWGGNEHGQLGDGSTSTRFKPVQIGTAGDWESVVAGDAHTLAIKNDGTLWAWGWNAYGGLGDGTTTERHSPVQVGTNANWRSVKAGSAHTTALRADGTLWAWGANSSGVLGDGTSTERHSPVQIGTDSDWQSVSARRAQTFAIKADGTLWAWGYNDYGQLGDGTTTWRTRPARVGMAADWRMVVAAYTHTLALKIDGTLWAWGNNQNGQLGDGTTTDRYLPVRIGLANTWQSVVAGSQHTLALAYVVKLTEDSGPVTSNSFAIFSPGPANESTQTLVGYAVSNDNSALFNVAPAINNEGTLTFSLATNANGSTTVTVVVQDDGGTANGGVDKGTNTFTIVVKTVNDTPSVAFATNNVVVLEDGGAQSMVGFATFTAGPTNETAQTLVGYAVTVDNAAMFSSAPAINNSGTLTFTPVPNANGTATVTVVVQDNGGTAEGGVDKATNTFTVTVAAVNDSPSFSIPVIEFPPGATWTARENNRVWGRSIASSTDGLRLAAVAKQGRVYMSMDSGMTWTPRGPIENWESIASSTDGKKLVAVSFPGLIYTSADSGLSWTPREFFRAWQCVTSSADGTKLAAAENGGRIHTSSDQGVTWTARGDHLGWQSIASSTDGTRLVAVAYNGRVHTSTDSGVTWTPRENYRAWASVASSADGTKLAAVVLGGQIYLSTDSGVTWTAREINRSWNSITSSADGTRLAACVYEGQIYISNDSGVTWIPKEDSRAWVSVATSPNGKQLVAAVFGGQLYTSAATTIPYAVTLAEDSGAYAAGTGFARDILPGPPDESSQTVTFTVANDNNLLFSVQPVIGPDGALTFSPAAHANGTANVTVVAKDNGGTANGGVDTSAPQTFTIVVTSVNDAPSVTFAQSTVTVLEDAGAQSVGAFATFSPGQANESAQTLMGYTVTVNNAALFNATPAINNAGMLTFTPAVNANGSATVTVNVQDNGGTANGGVDKSTNTFTIVVTAVNDTPVASADSYTMNQGDVLTVAAAGVLANDTDVENNPLTATKLTNPAHGSITFNTSGGFTYTPDANFYGLDSFTYRASDASSNSAPATVSISVLARPVITPPPGKQRVFSSAALRFSATNAPDLNAIRVSDPDSTALTLTLAVTNGTLGITVTNGLVFPNGFTNTNSLVLTGLIANLNDALESLAYVSTTNFFGDDALVLVAQDEGGRTNRGNGVFEIQVVIPARGPSLDVPLNGYNNPGLGRTVTNATAVTLDTNLVQGVTYDPTNNVVRVQPVGGQDGATNRSTVTVMARYSDGTTELITVPVIIYNPLLTTTTNSNAYDATFTTPLFNLQTSLYEQKVRVQNNTPFDFTALRITATNLPATVTLQNATITNGGLPYIEHNLAVAAGSNVTLKLEYFSSDLRPFTPGLKLELLNQQRTNSAPTNTTMSAVSAKRGFSPDGAAKNYLKFPTELGRTYYVQYQDVAGPVWKTSPVTLRGTGFFLNWLDDGPPNTDTPPGPARFYRVVTDR